MVHTRRGICAGVWVTVPMLVMLAFILTSPLTPTHAAEGQAKVDRLVMGVQVVVWVQGAGVGEHAIAHPLNGLDNGGRCSLLRPPQVIENG